jgi:hypothetical protein
VTPCKINSQLSSAIAVSTTFIPVYSNGARLAGDFPRRCWTICWTWVALIDPGGEENSSALKGQLRNHSATGKDELSVDSLAAERNARDYQAGSNDDDEDDDGVFVPFVECPREGALHKKAPSSTGTLTFLLDQQRPPPP